MDRGDLRKVAMIGPELYPIPPIRGGAAELWIEKACRVLKGCRSYIFCPADPELPDQETMGGVQYFRIPRSPLRKTLSRWLHICRDDYPYKIATILETIDPDIIHIHNRPLLVLFFRRRFPEKRVILHMHNLYDYLGRDEKPHGVFQIDSDAFVACSRFVLEREKHRLAVGARRQGVIYNGVETEAFRPSWMIEGEAAEVRRRHGLMDKKVVLYTGKIRESKGVGFLLAAMKEVFQKDPRTVLVLAGGTGFGYKTAERRTDFYKRLLEEIDSCRERVILLGFIPPSQMPSIYLLGDIFVAPSQLDEGLGMVFLEASASGLPIISTRQGGIPEVVVDGTTGVLLKEKNNGAELAATILSLLQNPDYGRELGTNGRKRVIEHFSWPIIGRTTEKFYDFLTDDLFGKGVVWEYR